MSEVEAWRSELEEAGELTPRAVRQLLDAHGSRARRAIEGVGERRVKQYRDFTVVVGHLDEYIVEGGTCTCDDTRYNLDSENPTDLCWHRLAVEIATRIGVLEDHDIWYSDVADLM